jgi:hypothetical protein
LTTDFTDGTDKNGFIRVIRVIRGDPGEGGVGEDIADAKKPDRIERLFLTSLNRRPTPEEVKKFAAFLEVKNSPNDAVRALITSIEFRFNH